MVLLGIKFSFYVGYLIIVLIGIIGGGFFVGMSFGRIIGLFE